MTACSTTSMETAEVPSIESMQGSPPHDLTCNRFEDDRTIPHWIYCAPLMASAIDVYSSGVHQPGELHAIERLLNGAQPLPQDFIVHEAYPDFTDAIDLLALSQKIQGNTILLLCAVTNPAPKLIRVCVGATGEGSSTRAWISGVSVQHGDFVRLNAGWHTFAIVVQVGRARPWQWQGQTLAPRFTQIEAADLQALRLWEALEAKADETRIDEASLLRSVKIVPETIRGQAGFFRVGKSDCERWWLLDPNGEPFYYRGVCALNRGGIGGRRLQKPPQPNATIEDWLQTMREWGFNGLGSWTTPEFFNRAMAYTEIIETYYTEPWLHTKFPDIYDPEWQRNVDEKCRRICTPLRESRDLVGYFIDNERGFMTSLGPNTTLLRNADKYVLAGFEDERRVINEAEPVLNPRHLGLLQYVLSLPENRPAVKHAWAFLLERHGSLHKAATAWGLKEISTLRINELTVNGERLISEQYMTDENEFVRQWVAHYYRTTIAAIRRYDPNHLILGGRWGGTPNAVVLAEEKNWTDVVSQNNYRAELAPRLNDTCRITSSPVLIGEVSVETDACRFEPNPIEPPGGYRSENERQQIRASGMMRRTFAHRSMVGYTMYKWNGKKPDAERMEIFRKANNRAVRLAVEGEPTLPDPLHGQIFLDLHHALPSLTELPAGNSGCSAGQLKRTEHLYIGLTCTQGVWGERVYGNGLRGRIRKATEASEGTLLELELELKGGLYNLRNGQSRYSLVFTHTRDGFTGSYSGTYNGYPVEGLVTGYLHRPIPSTKL